jgi:hypothetical protein
VEEAGDRVIPFSSRTTVRERRKGDDPMAPVLVLLTVIGCIGIKSLARRSRQIRVADESKA